MSVDVSLLAVRHGVGWSRLGSAVPRLLYRTRSVALASSARALREPCASPVATAVVECKIEGVPTRGVSRTIGVAERVMGCDIGPKVSDPAHSTQMSPGYPTKTTDLEKSHSSGFAGNLGGGYVRVHEQMVFQIQSETTNDTSPDTTHKRTNARTRSQAQNPTWAGRAHFSGS